MFQRTTICLTIILYPAVNLRSQENSLVTNLGLESPCEWISGKWLALSVYEGRRGEDLNGDGDAEDRVLHVRDLETAETTNLQLAGKPTGSARQVKIWDATPGFEAQTEKSR